MNEILKRQFSLMLLVIMMLQISVVRVSTAFAANLGQVVINEVSWAGTEDNSSDEWIELYNTSNEDIDLSNWYIEDDGDSRYLIESGVIEAHGFFLIEDKEEALSNIQSDAVIGLSLANSGDSLSLFTGDDMKIDTVNESGGAWYAGDSVAKSSMERIDPNGDDVPENWANSGLGNALGRDGGPVLGTPSAANANFDGAGMKVLVEVDGVDEFVDLVVRVDTAEDLYAYGFDILYDGDLLEFESATELDFLNSDGADTAFNTALADGQDGHLIIGNARLLNPANGLDGDGELFKLRFTAKNNIAEETEIQFGVESFVSDSDGKAPVALKSLTLQLNGAEQPPAEVNPVQNLIIEQGEERYSLALNWMAPADGANSYIIQRAGPNGEFTNIGSSETTTYIDTLSLVVGVQYNYRVIAVRENTSSAFVEINGEDDRGLVGDNNRSDRVDGGDIEGLARSYASVFGDEGYSALMDSNFDGVIDGNDLIDIGVNFGLSY